MRIYSKGWGAALPVLVFYFSRVNTSRMHLWNKMALRNCSSDLPLVTPFLFRLCWPLGAVDIWHCYFFLCWGKQKQKYGMYLLNFALAKFVFVSLLLCLILLSFLLAGTRYPAQAQESDLKMNMNSYSFHFYYFSDANMYWNLH